MKTLNYLFQKFLIELKLNGLKKTINKFLLKANIKRLQIVTKNENVYLENKNYYINNRPLVSVIIPFKDKSELLKKCIDSIYKSTYKNFEIIAISNNSEEKETFELLRFYEKSYKNFKWIEYNIPFNFSKINNYAVNFAKGEYIVFMNNDIKLVTQNWIEEFLKYAVDENIGTIGAKLYYPNDTIQHAGIVMLDKHGFSEHIGRFEDRFSKETIYNIPRYVMANTAALIMMKKDVFEKIGRFDENLAIDYNDVDLSLKCLEKGYKNIWLPYVEAYHYESISRGNNRNIEKLKRFEKERKYLSKKYSDILREGDWYYDIFY